MLFRSVVLGEARFGPESRIAELWFEVGSGARIHSRVEFTLKRIEGAWHVIEWEPRAYGTAARPS
mgnify:CR=1 FL=1